GQPSPTGRVINLLEAYRAPSDWTRQLVSRMTRINAFSKSRNFNLRVIRSYLKII
ncbi:6603_t:CDS:1, partial [Cetraspora pellucida]